MTRSLTISATLDADLRADTQNVQQVDGSYRSNTLGANRRFLIGEVAKSQSLDGRFTGMTVVNCDPVTGDPKPKSGVLSVVFRALDTHTNQPVAVKFFDPDRDTVADSYRYDLFRRECDLLVGLQGRDRCLQLIQPIHEMDFTLVNPATGQALVKKTYYFVVEWLDKDLRDYFLNQQAIPTDKKLEVFRQIVLSAFALHNAQIFHRDLKPENLRSVTRGAIEVAVAIDLGTAAMFTSATIGTPADYLGSVGTTIYSPVESHCGLSGVRTLGIYTDVYSLGCMLHDMFNLDMFFVRQIADAGYLSASGLCHGHMIAQASRGLTQQQLIAEWHKLLNATKRKVTTPSIEGPGNSVPLACRDLLDTLLMGLTAFDYRDRITDRDQILRYIDSALRIMNNALAEKAARDLRRQRRQAAMDKIRMRAEKLAAYLATRKSKGIS